MSSHSESSEGQKRRSSRSPFNDRKSSKKSRIESLEMETRLLIPSKHAGAIIGKSGSTINRLREKYAIILSLPDSTTPERVLALTGGNLKNHIDCLEEILTILKDSDRIEDVNLSELRMLVHQSQAGAVIGKGGARIREMREHTGATVKVFATMCPNSSDRIVLLAGKPSEIIECLYEVYDTLDKAPPKGPRYNYNPYDYDHYLAPEYGGFLDNRPKGGKMHFAGGRPPMNGPPGGMPYGGGHQMPPGGYPPAGPPYGMAGGMPPRRPPPPPYNDDDRHEARRPHYGLDGNANGDQPVSSTQVTIPKDLAGAIIGRGGERIRQIREESNAKIKIDQTIHGDNERIITIEGTPGSIRYAQVLLQDSVRRFGGKKGRF